MASAEPNGAPGSTGGPRRGGGGPLRGAAALVLAESAALLVAGAVLAVEAAAGEVDDPTAAWLTVGLVLLLAAGLVGAGLGLVRARRWARAPALVVQLLLLPVGVPLLEGGELAVGVPVVLVALAGLALLLHPATGRALQG